MTAEAILRLVNDPVLPFYPLDIALDVQNKLKDKSAVSPALLSSASSLRDHAAFFQSETMRPANDPKERDPSHVRMLNDVLRDLEKSFIIPQTPPGVYRNQLYSLPGKTPQFSILRFSQEAVLHCNVTSKAAKYNSANKEVLCLSNMNQSLSLILRAIRSAERLVFFGLDLFENYPSDTK
ncbi:inactive N-acetylated-alpha-linked acidic dipeptidase-like protein 2 [Stegastes partitus]|uniref:Inactive N-acetylated-alpha-linked acidic dipeptidase-like protein 2 n=1 Tax=Stegastes partitus TaxID=144197 RepID=A0A9Y4NTU6_9TELE|nr:PREDICTED: inactive N-acetylated-alpha-linked acidic dipeptidase-like protein 2 [Stegastes partitus]